MFAIRYVVLQRPRIKSSLVQRQCQLIEFAEVAPDACSRKKCSDLLLCEKHVIRYFMHLSSFVRHDRENSYVYLEIDDEEVHPS